MRAFSFKGKARFFHSENIKAALKAHTLNMVQADNFQSEFAEYCNVIRRDFMCGKHGAALFFNPDLTDAEALRQFIRAAERGGNSLEEVQNCVTYISESRISGDVKEAVNGVLSGDGVFVLEGADGFIIINARKYDKRAVTEPPTETVIRGPREGFTEDIKTNLSLLERRFKSPNLCIERFTVGRQSNTAVAVVYMDSVADKETVKKITERIRSISLDTVTDSNYLVPYLEERPNSIFKQVGYTEKPDVASAKIAEGRVAVITDGSPMALTLPFLIMEDFQSGDDYYERSSFTSFLRIVRLLALFLAVLLPGVYVAFQVFHYEMLPYRFLITLSNAVKGVPLPPMWEMMFVLLLFEVIRDASVRMPRAVSMAMSIVGAIVLGDTAVKAGLVSSPAVMLAALSSIALFTAPNEVGAMSLMRLIVTAAGGLAGALGIIAVSVYTVHYLCRMDSYGSPYLAPFAPRISSDLKDGIMLKVRSDMKKRPFSIPTPNRYREGGGRNKERE